MLKCWSHQTSPITLQKWCFDPSQVLQLLAAPPPPQSMLESNTGKRAHATGCTFPTLIGGAGGPPEGGKVSHFFLTQKIRFLNALFLRRTGRILEEPEFFPCNTFFGRFTSSRRSRRIFYFRFRRDGAPSRCATTRRHGYRRALTRFRTQTLKLRPRKIFET